MTVKRNIFVRSVSLGM